MNFEWPCFDPPTFLVLGEALTLVCLGATAGAYAVWRMEIGARGRWLSGYRQGRLAAVKENSQP